MLTKPVPSLKSYAVDPAGLLPDSKIELGREIRSCRDQPAVCVTVPREPGGPPHRRNSQTQIVIFRQAIGGERDPVGFCPGERGKCIMTDRAAHTGRRHTGAQCVTHDHCLAMCFGKFFTIMATDLSALRLWNGQNGQLHQVGTVHRPGEQSKPCSINHVFCIMDNDHPRLIPAALFVFTQSLIQAIETICLGGQSDPVMYPWDRQRLPLSPLQPLPGHWRSNPRRPARTIAANKQHVADGCADEASFLSGGDEDRCGADERA